MQEYLVPFGQFPERGKCYCVWQWKPANTASVRYLLNNPVEALEIAHW